MIISSLQIIGGLVLLVYGADRFVTGAANTSRLLGVSPLIIGLTIVGMATSVPEILVGSVAALDGKTHIAVGNAIGSNIANIGLVLGGTAAFRAFTASSRTLGREYFIMIGALTLGLVLMLDRTLDRLDAVILLAGLVGFLCWTVYSARQTGEPDILMEEIQQELPQTVSAGKSILLLFAGLVILFLGARVLVTGAVEIALAFGISELVIGLTIIAVGTSLPELAACIVSIIKNEADLAIGNILGSNIFNMLAVLGIPVMIRPDMFEMSVLTRDVTVMFFLSIVLGWIILHQKKFLRIHGYLLILIFVAYQCLLLTNAG